MKIQILLCLLVCAVLISYSEGRRKSGNQNGGNSNNGWFGGRREQGVTTKGRKNGGGRGGRPGQRSTTAMPGNETHTRSEIEGGNSNSTDSAEEMDVFSWLESLELFGGRNNRTGGRRGGNSRDGNRRGGKGGRSSQRQNQMGGSSENSRRQGKKGGRGSSGKEGTTPSWCLTYCYNWMSKAGNFEQAFPNTNIPESFKRTAIRFFCKEASESLCNANGTLPSNLTVTVDPTGNSTEPISCLSGDDCEMDECCVIGRSGMRCEKLSSLGDTCRNTEGNENPTDFYIFKCPCAEGLECQVNQSDNSMRGERRRKFKGQCVESNTTTPSPEMTTPDLIEVTPPIPTTCVEHMDCPLSQCCTISAKGDKSSGVCKSFSAEGATCSTPETFLEFSQVGACPCQAPNQCQTSTGFSADPTVNGICKP